MAAALTPWLVGFAISTQNLGAALVAGYLSRVGSLSIGVVSGVTLLIMPNWPLELWSNLGENHHVAPAFVLSGLGLLLLLAIIAYRFASGRLLTVAALMPQLIWWNDPLILWLIPRTLFQSLFLTGLSWVDYGLWCLVSYGPAHVNIPDALPNIFIGAYFPALALVLWQYVYTHTTWVFPHSRYDTSQEASSSPVGSVELPRKPRDRSDQLTSIRLVVPMKLGS